MKQKVKPVKKAAQPKKPTQFAIEMDVKGIGFFLLLGLGAALIVFYLGFTYGKATRDPNRIVLNQSEQESAALATKAAEVEKNLKIFDIREDATSSKIAALKKNSEETLSDANRIISASKNEAAAAATSRKKPASPQATVENKAKFKPQWPDKPEKKRSGGGLYTYQITSTKDIQRATTLVKHLKQKGFDAYRVAFDFKGDLFYRVRVGRGTKTELKAMEGKLKKVISGGAKPKLMPYGQ